MKKLLILTSLLISGSLWAEGPELKSLLEHIEEKGSTDSSAQENLEIFILEKCSAISFAVMDDTEEFDLGDAFFMEALDVEDEEKLTEEKILLLYERVKNYTSEYFDLLEGSEPSKGWKWSGLQLPGKHPQSIRRLHKLQWTLKPHMKNPRDREYLSD